MIVLCDREHLANTHPGSVVAVGEIGHAEPVRVGRRDGWSVRWGRPGQHLSGLYTVEELEEVAARLAPHPSGRKVETLVAALAIAFALGTALALAAYLGWIAP